MLLLLSLLATGVLAGQRIRISGIVLSQGSANPLVGATVYNPEHTAFAKTDAVGKFSLLVEKLPNAIEVEAEGFVSRTASVPGELNGVANVGTVFMVAEIAETGEELDRFDSAASLQSDGDDFGAAATVSSLLSASRDPFQQAAAFNFNATRFRIRGYDNRYTEVFLNGAPVNDMEAGRAYFYQWGGLNDVTRNRYNTVNLSFNPFDPSALGGIGNIDTRAGSQRAVTRVSVAASNRSWRYRGMATHHTGWLTNGWAFSVSGSVRYADQGYLPGTYQQGYGYFMGAEKRFGESHRLAANILASPSLRGGASSAVQEVYDVVGSNYYNQNWGLQDGVVRNSREYRTHQPMLSLTHEWSPSQSTNLQTSLVGVLGRNGQTRLERNAAPNPLGTYYQYLPSFSGNPETAAAVRAQLRENPLLLQIDWDRLYAINRGQQDVIENADGILGNTVAGSQARYWVEEQRADPKRWSLATRFRHALSTRITLHVGLTGQVSNVHNYKRLDDLLGADFVLDINQFAIRDLGSVEAAQNNADIPNKIVTEGDRFGWDYNTLILQQQAFTQLEYVGSHFDVLGALTFENEYMQRRGNVRNGQFPTNSIGRSSVQRFQTGAAKLNITYKANGRNYISLHGYYGTKSPDFRDAMTSPRTRNEWVPNLEAERIVSAELNYQYQSPKLKAKLTGYATHFANRMRNVRFFIETIDNATGFGSYVLQGMDAEHVGVEAAAEYNLSPSFEINAALAAGRYLYTSRPTANAYTDNSGEQLVTDETIYLRNFFVGQTPQQVSSLGLRYVGEQFYTVTLTSAYMRYSFADFSPLRRTADAVRGLEPGSQEVQAIIDQEELPGAFTLDLFVTKSFKFGNRFIYLTAAVNNLLDKQNIISGAREQLRYDFERQDISTFPNQYFYAYGTNFFAQVAFQF